MAKSKSSISGERRETLRQLEITLSSVLAVLEELAEYKDSRLVGAAAAHARDKLSRALEVVDNLQ